MAISHGPKSASGKKHAMFEARAIHELSHALFQFLRVATRRKAEKKKKYGRKKKQEPRDVRGKAVIGTRRDVERNNDSRCRPLQSIGGGEFVISHSAMR